MWNDSEKRQIPALGGTILVKPLMYCKSLLGTTFSCYVVSACTDLLDVKCLADWSVWIG